MVAQLLKLATLAAFAFLFCFGQPGGTAVFAQNVGAASQAPEKEEVARRFDEFVGLLGECELTARLDNLAVQLMNEPETIGYLVAYAGRYELPARFSAYRERLLHYLIEQRGIDPERLNFIDGGHRELLTTELWIAPQSADAPKPTDAINPAAELDKAFKLAEQYISVATEPEYQVEDSVPVEEVADETAETATDDVTDELPAEEQADAKDASAASEEIAEEPIEAEKQNADADVWWLSKDYARALDIEARARGYIIFYADRGEASFSKVQAVVEQAMKQLVEKYHIKAERLAAVFGGYRRLPKAELWLVPSNASLPVPTPEPEREPKDEATAQAAEPPPLAP
jgi:hypothetical protein